MSLSTTINQSLKGKVIKQPSSFGRVDFNLFFNKPEVKRRFDRKERRVLGGTGAFGRGAMRRSIKKAGKKYDASEHRGPPKYHSRGFGSLKDGIFFQADLDKGSVIIGPNKLRTNVRPVGKQSSAQLIDEGGAGVVTSFRYNKPSTSGKQRPGKWQKRRGKWRERSFTKPAWAPTRKRMLELIEKVEL